MWFGTEDGLNLYDGYDFRIFDYDAADPTSLRDDYIYTLTEDSAGHIWIGTRRGGLYAFDPATDRLTPFEFTGYSKGSFENRVLLCDESDRLWIGTSMGLLKVDIHSGEQTWYRHDPNKDTSLAHDQVMALSLDERGSIWVGTRDGLSRLDPIMGTFENFYTQGGTDGLPSNVILSLLPAGDRDIWVGTSAGLAKYVDAERRFQFFPLENPNSVEATYLEIQSLCYGQEDVLWVGTNYGIVRMSTKAGASPSFERFSHVPGDPRSLAHNQVRSMYEDENGSFWVGTWGGSLSHFDRNKEQFGHVYHVPGKSTSLGSGHVWCFMEESDHVLWVGTEGSGLCRRDPETGEFKTYLHTPGDPTSLSSNNIHSVTTAHEGHLWVASFSGLDLFHKASGKVVAHYEADGENPNSLSDNNIWILRTDRRGILWVGTEFGGLTRFDPSTKQFTQYRHDPNKPDGLGYHWVMSLMEDRKDRLFVGTFGGGVSLLVDQEQGLFKTYTHDPEDPNSLSNNNISHMLEAAEENKLWVATYGGGLNLLDLKTGKSRIWREREGLPDMNLYGIAYGEQGTLWFSTNDGLVRFWYEEDRMEVFTISDGLQDNEFNSGAFHRGPDGKLYFGGLQGYNGFYPAHLQKHHKPPRMALTAFLRDNKIVRAQPDNPNATLQQPIGFTSNLRLTHKDKVVAFRFAALHYASPNENAYKYTLEGFDDTWIETSANNRLATFTGLDPGHYTFRVKGSNKDGVWDDDGLELSLEVVAPPWLSWWARAFYLLCILAMLYLYAVYHRRRVVRAQAISKRLEQMDRLRDDFLANTSHELRTPLNGIIGLTESLIDGSQGDLNSEVRKNLGMVVSSGRRLKSLVDDILDFSKLKHDNLTLQTRPVALAPLADLVFTMCEPLVQNKDVKLVNRIRRRLPAVMADEDRLQQILYNLIGNAIRFTDKGEVEATAERIGSMILVTVNDTGIGISDSFQDQVFDSFVQVRQDDYRGGTGLGLALSRRLVKLHGGEISLESACDVGTKVTFTLPISDKPATPFEYELAAKIGSLVEIEEPSPEETQLAGNIPALGDEHCHILVVDDEPINIQVLLNHLKSDTCQITYATNGEHALRLLKEDQAFDLVLLDIMMPGLDGYQTCRKIRETWPLEKLPVIFLTAKNQIRDLTKAYESGGNDFITKPVARAELLSRVGLHLQQLFHGRRLKMLAAEQEALNHIATAINRELDLDSMLEAMLEQGLSYFPTGDAATVFLWDSSEAVFRVAASRGYDMNALRDKTFSKEDLISRYIDNGRSLEEGTSDVSSIRNVVPMTQLEHFTANKAMLCIPLAPKSELEGFLVIDSLSDSNAFSEADLRRAKLFREHAVWALAKSRLLQQLSAQNKAILDAQEQLVNQEKMASLGFLAAGISHEVKNPAGFVLGSIQNLMNDLKKFRAFLFELMEEDADDEISSEIADRIQALGNHGEIVEEGARRITRIVRDLGNFSRKGDEIETVDLTVNLISTINLVRAKYKQYIALSCEFETPINISCYPSQLNQVFMNLVVNACQAIRIHQNNTESRELGQLVIHAEEKDDFYAIHFSDNGCGIPEDKIEHIFEAFFTTKKAGVGTGLGLAISRNIIADHGGELNVTSKVGEGTTFTVSLPKKRPENLTD